MSLVTFSLGPTAGINVQTDLVKVGTFIDWRLARNHDAYPAAPINVVDAFRPMTTNLVRTVALGDSTHLSPLLDLSALDGPFVLPAADFLISAVEGAYVRVKIGDRRVAGRTPLITWTGTRPTWVDSLRFVRGDDERSYGITVRDDGIYICNGLIITIR